MPELDQNFLFPNSSLVLAELGLGSRFRESAGARHTNISSWHLSPALLPAPSPFCGLPPPLYPSRPSKHVNPVLDGVRQEGRRLAAGTESRRTGREPGR